MSDYGLYCDSCDEMVFDTAVVNERHEPILGQGCGAKVRKVHRIAPTPSRLEAARDDLLRVTLIYHDACIHPAVGDNYALGTVYHDWHLACVEYLAAMEEDSGT